MTSIRVIAAVVFCCAFIGCDFEVRTSRKLPLPESYTVEDGQQFIQSLNLMQISIEVWREIPSARVPEVAWTYSCDKVWTTNEDLTGLYISIDLATPKGYGDRGRVLDFLYYDLQARFRDYEGGEQSGSRESDES